MTNNQDRYVELFLDEAAEHIDNLNTNLLALEKDHHNPEIINEIFRSAHTLKSSAAFVGLETFSHLAHKMEDLFQKIREGSIQANTNLVTLLFSCLDRIKQAVAVIQNGSMPTDSYADLIVEIEAFLTKNQAQTNEKKPETVKPELVTSQTEAKTEINEKSNVDVKSKQILLTDAQKTELRKLSAGKSVYHGYVSIDEDAPMKNMRFLLLVNKLNRIGTVFISDPMGIDLEEGSVTDSLLFIYYGTEKKETLFDTCQIDMVEEIYIVELSLDEEEVPTTSADENNIGKVVERKPELNLQETHLKTRNIKVSSDKIDYLLNNVGELVITNSGLLKIYEDLSNEIGESSLLGELKSRIDQAGRIARDLQSGIMKTRMIPIGIVFQRFQRPVRDLALSIGKEIELHTEGEDTELDKNIIDALNDPLLHLIRNALDHGIEPREDRIKAGKDPIGHITLKAYQSGNSIFVEIRDDGRGLNRQKLLEKGIQKGLVDPTAIPTDEEIFNLIFLPGFSTAQQVSDLSGRGVGMNVVRQMVSEFKGSVQVQNSAGAGSAFILSFPLTLAIISAILVKVAGEEYAFPLSDVVETIRINKSEITRLQGKNIINLRNEIVPIFRLSQLMGLPPKHEDEEFPVVIASIADRKIGYIVDDMAGKKEIVIKSLEQNYRRVDGLIGACLMGDGSIVMVLDVHGLMTIANQRKDRIIEKNNDLMVNAITHYNDRVRELAWSGRKLRNRERSTVKPNTTNGKSNNNEKVVNENEPKNENNSISMPISSNGQPTNIQIPPIQKPAEAENPKTETVLSKSISNETTVQSNKTISDEQVNRSLESFKDEREERMEEGMRIFSAPTKTANQDLSEADYNHLYSLINTGMINGGLVLSQLLGVTVEVTVPEFQTIEYRDLKSYLPGNGMISVFLETEGDFYALLMLVFDESTGYGAAGELMGISAESRNKESMNIDDVESVLSELTNIVGSSLLNEMANRTRLSITPTVPQFVHGTVNDILKYIESKNNPNLDSRFIYISTDFLREDTELLGRMFLLPNRPDLMELVRRIK